MMIKKALVLIVAWMTIQTLHATQVAPDENTESLSTKKTSKFDLGFGTSILSSYISRGSFQSGPCFQPTFDLQYGDFSFNAWASVDFTGAQMREVNLGVSYNIGRFRVSIIDYYITPLNSTDGRFFQFGSQSPHSFEAILFYTVSKRVPIGIFWGTVFAGADVANNGRRNYSSYAEVSYPFTILKVVQMKSGVGVMPWSTENCYNTKGFAVTNVYLNATREWELKGNMRIGVTARLICNPYREQFNFVGGVSFNM